MRIRETKKKFDERKKTSESTDFCEFLANLMISQVNEFVSRRPLQIVYTTHCRFEIAITGPSFRDDHVTTEMNRIALQIQLTHTIKLPRLKNAM